MSYVIITDVRSLVWFFVCCICKALTCKKLDLLICLLFNTTVINHKILPSVYIYLLYNYSITEQNTYIGTDRLKQLWLNLLRAHVELSFNKCVTASIHSFHMMFNIIVIFKSKIIQILLRKTTNLTYWMSKFD